MPASGWWLMNEKLIVIIVKSVGVLALTTGFLSTEYFSWESVETAGGVLALARATPHQWAGRPQQLPAPVCHPHQRVSRGNWNWSSLETIGSSSHSKYLTPVAGERTSRSYQMRVFLRTVGQRSDIWGSLSEIFSIKFSIQSPDNHQDQFEGERI